MIELSIFGSCFSWNNAKLKNNMIVLWTDICVKPLCVIAICMQNYSVPALNNLYAKRRTIRIT